ncbi:MAG: DNA/RNA non-specific endonuclease [Bacteroidales bacterium]|nr:DNA/RNA non-specific endonuclease [Bacteroidales bacterium]HPY82414.1 DNA/RNA non-specific endonuclease [Bacteroidales bacterium]
MKNIFWFIGILCFLFACMFFYWEINSITDTTPQYTSHFVHIPDVEIPESNKPDSIYTYVGFSLQYAEQFKQAYWVAYMHCKAKMLGNAKRTNTFKKDPNIVVGSASAVDYRKSGYDRGHLAPAGDMKWNVQAMKESFYYSNISPQLPQLNRGVWKKLEDKVRDWVHIYDTLYIITGPILHDSLPTIGINKVAVPEYFYKIVLLYSSVKQDAVGFIIPNSPYVHKDFEKYMVSVDSVEKHVNMSFFMQVPKNVRKNMKKNNTVIHWN